MSSPPFTLVTFALFSNFAILFAKLYYKLALIKKQALFTLF